MCSFQLHGVGYCGPFHKIHSNWVKGYRSLYHYSTVHLFTISEILAVIK